MSSRYYLIYPRGDRTKLCTLEVPEGMEYELMDFAIASRNSFDDEEEACVYGQKLADTHKLTFDAGSRYREYSTNTYLD